MDTSLYYSTRLNQLPNPSRNLDTQFSNEDEKHGRDESWTDHFDGMTSLQCQVTNTKSLRIRKLKCKQHN